MHRIFLVEDDEAIAGAVISKLTAWGYTAAAAQDFREVLREFAEFAPQLVLLDISLPFFNGYHWCSEIRKLSSLPIIFISSAADSMNIVMAMNMGGDDFISKPFDLEVLIAKIQALLRRSYELPLPEHSNLLEHNGLILSLDNNTAFYEEKEAELSKNEQKILRTLLESCGKIVTRETLMLKLWETDSYVDENTLSVNIARLRKKLAEICPSELITTKKGIGYIIT